MTLGLATAHKTTTHPGEGNGNPLQYFLSGKFHGQGSLVGYSLWGRKESGMTVHTHVHPLQQGAEVFCNYR